MKKILWFVIVCILLFSVIFFAFFEGEWGELSWFFQKNFGTTSSLNLSEDISSIRISKSLIFGESVIVSDKESITELINMLNSLEVVKRPEGNISYLVRSPAEVEKENEKESLWIHVEGYSLLWIENGITMFPSNMPDKMGITYHVKNVELSFQDEDNEIVRYIRMLTEENKQ